MVLHILIEALYKRGIVGNPKFSCPYCNYYFHSEGSRDKHIMKEHRGGAK